MAKSASAGNPESGENPDVYSRYRQELRQFFARRARQSDGAEDLVQLVYLRLLRSRPTRLILDPRMYLYKIAWNVLRRDNLRVQREQRRLLHCDAATLEQFAGQVRSLWIDDSGTALASEHAEALLQQLPPGYQTALLRHYRDGWTYAQIAAELGVTTHTVKKYIVRGLALFRAHLSPRDNGC